MTTKTAKKAGLKAARRIEAPNGPEMCIRPEPGRSVTKPGDLIMFSHLKNGLDSHQKHAMKYLRPFCTYKVKSLIIHAFSSQVEVEEVSGLWFNTMLFSNA